MSLMGTLIRTIKESPEIIEGLAKGTLTLWGGVIRRAKGQEGAGQIVAHVIFPDNPKDMENSVSQLQQAMNQHYSNLQSSIDNVQQQLQTGLSSIQSNMEVLQGLQVANLALSGLNLAVSVAGFAIVCQKLNAISNKLDTHTEQLNEIISLLHEEKQRNLFKDHAKFTALMETLEQFSESDTNDFSRLNTLVLPLREQFNLNKLILINAVNATNLLSKLNFETIEQLQKRFVYLGMAVAFVSAKTNSPTHAIKDINKIKETLNFISEQLVGSTTSEQVLKSISKEKFTNIKSIVSLKKSSLPALDYQKHTLELVASNPDLEDLFKQNSKEILLIAA